MTKDAYIAKAKPFAQPVLEHLRELVHKGCPTVEETVKWGMPFFEYEGAILANMSGFNAHCKFGFWGSEMGAVMLATGLERKNGGDSLGAIKSVKDLPADKVMVELVRQAVGSIARGEQVSPLASRKEKKAAAVVEALASPELMAALKKNKAAAAVFAKCSASAQKEYVAWIVEAKREETRARRVAAAVEWIAEGKQRNWKYQNI
ncbi:MAG: YdeI/OmpD-associated family protein [Granulicella sp.]